MRSSFENARSALPSLEAFLSPKRRTNLRASSVFEKLQRPPPEMTIFFAGVFMRSKSTVFARARGGDGGEESGAAGADDGDVNDFAVHWIHSEGDRTQS